jgi:micrococcal nuclease
MTMGYFSPHSSIKILKIYGGITMKRFALSLLVIFLLTACAFAESQYIASRNREPFHVTSCRWAEKISPSNAVYYNTREEAIKAGHRPCKVCNP